MTSLSRIAATATADLGALPAGVVVPAQRTAPDLGASAWHGPALDRSAALWPPERDAASRLARARDTLARRNVGENIAARNEQ